MLFIFISDLGDPMNPASWKSHQEYDGQQKTLRKIMQFWRL